MAIVLGANPSKQRAFEPYELLDENISPNDYFGMTSNKGGQVWHFDGTVAVRVGIPNPDHHSRVVLKPDQALRDALSMLPMFVGEHFVIHRMALPPGGYFRRIARPNDQNPTASLGFLPDLMRELDALMDALNQLLLLLDMLKSILKNIHPDVANMNCFGGAIRNLLMLACTECEAQWRGALNANGYSKPRTTTDYVKLLPAMRLSEYEVKLRHYPALSGFAPFHAWDPGSPTRSISWYDAYNAAKHDRMASFQQATLQTAIQSVAAIWIMIAAQYGFDGITRFPELASYFKFERLPLWRYSDVYTYGYPGHDADAGPQNFVF